MLRIKIFYKCSNINFVVINFVTKSVLRTAPPPPGGVQNKNLFLVDLGVRMSQ